MRDPPQGPDPDLLNHFMAAQHPNNPPCILFRIENMILQILFHLGFYLSPQFMIFQYLFFSLDIHFCFSQDLCYYLLNFQSVLS